MCEKLGIQIIISCSSLNRAKLRKQRYPESYDTYFCVSNYYFVLLLFNFCSLTDVCVVVFLHASLV